MEILAPPLLDCTLTVTACFVTPYMVTRESSVLKSAYMVHVRVYLSLSLSLSL